MRRSLAGAVLLAFLASAAGAHPGSAIGVTADGRVFFVDTGAGVFSIVRPGVVRHHEGPAFHWFAIDSAGHFRNTPWPYIPGGELRAAGVNPTVILSSDVPIAISGTTLFFPEKGRTGDPIRIIGVDASGKRAVRAELPAARSGGNVVPWINDLAAGPDGSLYYTEDRTVRKVDRNGQVTRIAEVATVPRCVAIPGIGPELGPYLRGLHVDADGTVYVAASGCGAVLKIDPRGDVTPLLRTSPPWSPTAITGHGGEIFVLEYLHTPSDNRREWLPRVRRIGRDGTVTTLANTARR